MENKKQALPELRKIDGPSGIDLYPNPPKTVRVSRRAGLLAVGLACGLGAILGAGVYWRGQGSSSASVEKEDPKNVAPATLAAQDITRSIPEGLLHTAEPTAPSEDLSGSAASATPTPTVLPAASVSKKAPPRAASTGASKESLQTDESGPTPQQQRRAEAYRRQLQAMSAGTVVSSSGSSGSARTNLNTPPSQPSTMDLLSPIYTSASTANSALHQDGPNVSVGAVNSKANGVNSDGAGITPNESSSQWTIRAGWDIPAVLEQDLNSDLPGETKALVSANVYDSATGRYLLIPQGARLIGVYDSAVAFGQNGLHVIWNRILYPDGSSVDLGGMVGQDPQGASGFRHDVDNHYGRLVGFTLLSTLFSAGFQVSQSRSGNILDNASVGETAAASIGQEVSRTGAEVIRRNLDIKPTLSISLGYRFNVRVNRELVFSEPYTVSPLHPSSIRLAP